jgi:AMMECR1 domain-containing protein
VDFVKGKADYPKIDGIVVTYGNMQGLLWPDIVESEFDFYQYLKTNWDDWLVELEGINQRKKE